MFGTETLPTVSTIPAMSASEPCSAQRAAWRTEPIPDRGAFLFVALIWAVMTGVGLVYVVRFGPTVLRWDDYTMVSRITLAEPITLSWLWSQQNEHRIPLILLVLLGLFRSSAADPRPALFVTVGVLSATSAVLLGALRKARGSSSYSDAILPIILLNLGHHEILLWASCLMYSLTPALMGFLLALVVRCGREPGLATMTSAGIVVALLPLCGGGWTVVCCGHDFLALVHRRVFRQMEQARKPGSNPFRPGLFYTCSLSSLAILSRLRVSATRTIGRPVGRPAHRGAVRGNVAGPGRSDTLALVDHRRPELPGRGGCHAGKSLVCRARRTDAHRGSGVYPGRRVSDGIGVGLGTVGTR